MVEEKKENELSENRIKEEDKDIIKEIESNQAQIDELDKEALELHKKLEYVNERRRVRSQDICNLIDELSTVSLKMSIRGCGKYKWYLNDV